MTKRKEGRIYGWNERKTKSETQRQLELKTMSPEDVIKWALAEIKQAHERESVHAVVAARLDDLLRSHLNRIIDIESRRGDAVSRRMEQAITRAVNNWASIVNGDPRTILLTTVITDE